MRRLLVTLGAVLLMAAVLAGSVAWLTLTEPGLRLALAWLFGGTVTAKTVSGRAIGPLRLTDVVIDLGAAVVRADRVELDWDPRAWLDTGRIEIRPLEIVGLDVEVTEQQAGTGPEPLVLARAIDVSQVSIKGIVLRSGAQRWRAQSARFSLIAEERSVRFSELDLQAENLSVSGSGTLGLNARDPLDFHVAWRVSRSDGTELGGRTRFFGSWTNVGFSHDGDAPFAWRADGEVRPLVAVPAWEVAVDIPRFEPSTVNADWPATPVSARLQFDGEGARAQTGGRLQVPEYSERPIALQGVFTARGERVVLQSVELSLDGLPARLVVDGELELRQTIGFDLSGVWRDLELEAGELGRLRSPDGRVQVKGEPQSYAGSFSGRVAREAEGQTPVEANVQGRLSGGTSALKITELSVRTDQGAATGEVDMDWSAEPVIRANLRGGPIDPGIVDPRLSGGITVALRVNASLPSAGVRYAIALDSLTGTVNGQPVTGHGRLDMQAGGDAQTELMLTVGVNALDVKGSVGQRLDLRWRLEARDLTQLVPETTGRIQGQGRLRGAWASPAVELQAEGEALRWQGVEVGGLELQARFDTGAGTLEQTGFEARAVTWRGVELTQISGSASGSVAAHRIQAEAVAADGRLRLQGSGGYEERRWTGQIASAYSESERLGRWRLQAPVAIEIGGQGARVGEACLANAPARLCGRGSWSEGGGWKAEARFEQVELDRLEPWLPQGLAYRGELSGEMDLHADAQGPWEGRALLEIREAALSRVGSEQTLTRISEGSLKLHADRLAVELQARIDLDGQGEVEAWARSGRGGPESALKGRLRGRVVELEFLTLLFPELEEVGGQISMDLELSGRLESPRYAGQLALLDGSATVIELGVTLEDIGLTLDGDVNGLRIAGSARSGDGFVTLDGRLDWSGRKIQGRLSISGERFRVADVSGIRVDASPALVIDIAGRDLELTGTVHVDEALIAPVGLSTATRVRISPDEVIVGSAPAEPKRWRVSSRVKVTLGDIEVDAYGLKGELKGALDISDLPGQVATATGMLTIEEGWYKAYGQTLDIDRGRLTYRGGPVDNPELDVRAVRYLETYLVGVNVRGTLQDPRIEVFSDPPRPRQYALYLLLLGEAPVELGRAGQSLSYGNPSAQFESDLGGAAAGASAGLGSFLSPDLYVGYLESLSLRYRISKKWAVEAERGYESSVGIIYSIR
jgi:translocation and assembly module TamB